MKRKSVILIFTVIIAILLCSCGYKKDVDDNESDYVSEDDYYQGLEYKDPDKPEKTYKSGDYTVSDFKGGICINKYSGSEKNIKIPEDIDGKKVVSISGYYSDEGFISAFNDADITSLLIPSSVEYISCLSLRYLEKLQNITVEDDNPYYSSVDSILYSKDKTVVLLVPTDYPKSELVFPDALTNVGLWSMDWAENVKSVKFGKSLQKTLNFSNYDLESWHFPYKIENIEVSEDNPNFCSKNGVLYNKNMTELICYPFAKPDEEYVLPDTVINIDEDNRALTDTKYLKILTVHKNIKKLDFEYFEGESYEGGYDPPTSITTIKGYKGTAAERFAKDNALEFIALD